ncbi:putative radical SAM superfamily Fe-S cluster-containing enzyme [Microbacterium terrae]|nr:radical SAM protein [Microbacterium terrae]MBP1076978.1 putative radical SAM superfamily Fe-S cluster-containing enzyme [Microbacterium terrae]GLJ99572.1 radical SAM protein [Microbacterium terrae]
MTTPFRGRTLGDGQPLRGDRIHRYVTAYCPKCHDPDADLASVRRLSGMLMVRDGRVWLERGCPDHGLVRTLYDEDPEILRYLEQWQAPTKQHVPDRPDNYRQIPEAYAYGLPAMQTQHTCILLEDVTEHCNLRCPTCFTASGPQLTGVAPLETVLANVDARLARENGRLDVLMLSGGEPTLYPQLEELLAELVERPVVRIMLNTNGMLIASDDRMVELLARHRDRLEVYLQYDGPSAEASVHHRGGDLTRFKDAAIERLSKAEIFTTLTMTAALGVNDHEIGDVVMRALETPFVSGIALQPVFGSGRGNPIDPMDRLTHTGVLARLGPQTGGVVNWHDLTALPCSHPHCASVGYLLKDDSGVWRSLVALVGHDELLQWLEIDPDGLANRVADRSIPLQLRELVKTSFLDLLSEQASPADSRTAALWQNVCQQCDLGISTLATLAASRLPGQRDRMRRLMGERVKRITIKPFQDISNMLEERLVQCCVHVGTIGDDGGQQCAPFCAVQAWGPLARQRVSTASHARASSGAPTVVASADQLLASVRRTP